MLKNQSVGFRNYKFSLSLLYNQVDLIDSIAQQRAVFCNKTQLEKSRGGGVLAKFTT